MTSPSTEDRIREAALALFAAKGFHATSVRDIAGRAGVTTASMYYYVHSKDELLADIMRDGIERLLSAALSVVADLSTPADQLCGLIDLHVWVHGVRQRQAQVSDAELRALTGDARKEILALRDEYQALWITTITEGSLSGAFQADDAHLAAFALLEMCTGISRWYSPRGAMSLAEISLAYSRYAMGMLDANESPRQRNAITPTDHYKS